MVTPAMKSQTCDACDGVIRVGKTLVTASMMNEILVMQMIESLGVWRTLVTPVTNGGGILVTPVIASQRRRFGCTCDGVTKGGDFW